MSSLNSLSTCPRTPTAYEINAREYGPAAATVIDTVAKAAQGASATVSFSSEGLQRLGDLAGSAVDGVVSVFTGAGEGVSSLGQNTTDELRKAYGVVEDSVQTVVSRVQEVVDTVGDGLTAVSDAVTEVTDAVSDGIDSVAGTAVGVLALGLSVLA